MIWIAGIGAVLCLMYYGIIVCYSGFSTSFAWFWPALAVFLLALAAGGVYNRLHPRRCPLWVMVSAVTFLGTSLVILCAVEVLIFIGAASQDPPGLDYVVVLGAKVEEGHISNSLLRRLEKAAQYGRKNPDTLLILSGGQGADEPATEASVMYDYLRRSGIPDRQLALEEQSTSTVENIAYSKVLIDRLEQEKDRPEIPPSHRAPGPYMVVEDKPVQIGVLTSNFHVFRAVQIGKRRGITDISGISAKSDPILFVHLCVRECAAILKDKLMGNM